MDIFFTPSFPVLCQDSRGHNYTIPCADNQTLNSTSPSTVNPPAFGMSYFTMTLGALSNLTALAILAHSYASFRRRAKVPFLLLASTLLLSDLAGHLITGALALNLHLERVKHHGQMEVEPPRIYCKLFGACMVFFGLCPLLLGSAMAVERCIGITQPLLHSTVVTMTRVRFSVLLITSMALTLAGLPLLNVGNYKPQFPGTWCFLPVNGPLSIADVSLTLAFSILGLLTLIVSLVSNTLSGLKLLQARIKDGCLKSSAARRHGSFSSSSLHSLDVEMMTQLAVITVVSCVCWSPFLIYILMSVSRFYEGVSRPKHQCEKLFLLALRLASWNQILDPWVYILLRRAVLRRVLQLLQPDRAVYTQSSSYRDSHRKTIS
ncbi:prostaglandin E receptor 1c (subtype EP1) isoform X2 [Danio rerio]|uniref:Thromboxane A2 receptor n=1 Tax=Danio rerio TaxID=7955 RepID=D0EXE4_DANRE|nr:prostaglandin E receptor 1c (subtype EP1) [Danio rerio]ACX47465.1 prostaglandin E2 receptor subtype EP1-like protein [Danio rerio]|eukprot:NP_001159763.1 prostaglandin E receptor 1c (subtype EP1) [Danio rerio]